ncbi:hypothetical protein MACK_003694 [Theileria orientalis]|uniref:Uncharacterized protein n=1 Tax=Theileria orientalis TaxID=68886 RepID=A0A976XJG6_THEOR|nr:hypothetical protein MACK_003694 [Theileria orientalis]
MMIDTISTYILVYLLTCVRINVYVSVKADGGQTSSSSQRAETQSGSSETHTSTPKTGVDLNIKSDTETKDQFDYKKDANNANYNAKDNNAFKLVKDDKTQIWKETNANNYSTKVEVECLASDGKAVTVCSAGDNTMVFKKSGKNEPWSEIDTTKLNPMPVNVSDHKETYFYSNKLLRSTITFEAHYGFGFNVVTETIGSRKVEIWKTSDPNEYAKIVEYTKLFYGKLDLTLHLKHGKKYFIKEREDEGWKEIDITKVNPKPVNIQDRYHSCFYTYSFNKDVRTFTAKTGFLFNRVKDGTTYIWSTGNENEYAMKVLAEGNKKVIIYTGDDGNPKVFIKASDNNWTEDTAAASSLPSLVASYTQPKVKLFKVNPSDAANPLELDANEYTSTQSGNVVTYQIAGCVNCVKLMFDDVLFWQHDPNQRGGKYPKSLDYDKSKEMLVLKFEGLDITFAKNDQGGWIFTESGPLAVKFHLTDPNDASKTVELASNQLTVTTNGDVTTFNIANGVNSIALTYGPALLWQHDQNQRGGKHPKSLDFTKSTETLVLMFDGFYLTFAKNDQGQWEYTETDTSAGGAATTPPVDPSGASKKPEVKLFKVNPSDAANPLELDANEYTSTQSGNVVTYQIAGCVNCVKLMFDDVLFWQHDPNQRGGKYPKSLDYDKSKEMLVLKFEGLDITFAKNDQGGWIFTESGPLAVKFHVVDPNDSSKTVELASNQLTVTTNGDVTTFNIANGVNSIALTYGPALLWQHDQNQRGGKHPKSLDFTKSTETLVLMFDGFYLTFAKNDQGQWEYTETDTSAGGAATTPPVDPSGASKKPEVKLFKVNPSDAANPLELDANEYTSTQSGNVVTYQIAGCVNCVKLMFDDVLFWQHDPNQRGGKYPKSLDYDKSKEMLVLKFEGLDITFAKNYQGGWIFTESGPLAVKFHVVDPNDSSKTVELASNQLTVTTNGDVTTFNIANGVNSIALTYGPALLWQHDQNQRGGKHPKSLDFTKSTETLVLMFDGFYLTFAKNDQGQWEYTETDTSAGGAATTTESDHITQSGEGDSTTPEDQGGSSTQPDSSDYTQADAGLPSGESADAGSSGEAKSPDGPSAEPSELTDPGSTAGEGQVAESGGWTSGSVQDGSASPPPADGGSGTDTSSGEGSGTNDDGTGKGAGEPTETGGEGEDGSSQTSDADGSGLAAPAGNEGSTAAPVAGLTAADDSSHVAEQDESSKNAKEGDSTTPEDQGGSSTHPEGESSTQLVVSVKSEKQESLKPVVSVESVIQEAEAKEEDEGEELDGEEVIDSQTIQEAENEPVPETTEPIAEPLHKPVTEPEPVPILNGLYPDVLRTGWSLDDLDISKKRKTVDTEFDPFIGFPSGWHDNSDIIENTVTFVNILPQMDLSKDDLVLDLSVITLATEDTPYKIIQGDDEMIIRKFKIDNVFKKYSCSLTNERSFKPQIRHFLSNFELDAEDVSKFELYVGEYDEPLLIRLTDPSGVKNFVHRGKNKWETLDIKFLDINTLDQNYIMLRDDITMIDCSKKSGHYEFGKYKIQVNELEAPNQDRIEGFKTYIHTIYHNTDSIEFASVKVHRFRYDSIALNGFMRYWMSKVYVYFWEHELTKPIYIRAVADHAFANYFGYPDYVMQTDVSLFPYFLKVTNFEVNNALVINLARHENYDFEGGISLHLTRHQIKVKPFNNTPINGFKKCIHTLTVGGVNKQFNILRFLNEPSLKEVITNVSSLETYFHNKNLNKPLMFIVNESSKQSFYKLENNTYVKMDNLIIDLENTLKYLAYLNYNYVTIDISKSSSYHHTGASDSSLFPDSSELVSVVKEELNEFSKFTHSVKVNNNQSKFKLIALDGVSISIDDRELTSVDAYFFNEHIDTPLLVVLRGDSDVVYAIKKSQPIKNDANILSPLYYNLRKLVKFNFGLMYLRLDQTSNYYSKQDDGPEIQVVHDGSVGNYTKYIHNFPDFSDIRFLVGDAYYRPKIDPPGSFTKAFVYKDSNDFFEIVSLIDDQEVPRFFIYQGNSYKRAKKESVDRKLGLTSSQVQTGENGQS